MIEGMVKYDVPFVSNTEDDLHCLQAAYMMIVKYYMPGFEIEWDEWDRLTGFEKGKGTWATASLLWFIDNGFEVRHISLFDYEDFAKNGGDYLLRLSGNEVGEWQVAHSNIPLEQERSRLLLESGCFEKREPTLEDVQNYLDKGYLLHVLVNWNRLAGKGGYFGHGVTVIGYDEENVYMHDPGGPPMPNRKVSKTDFEAAWADPNKENKELDAIRLVRQANDDEVISTSKSLIKRHKTALNNLSQM